MFVRVVACTLHTHRDLKGVSMRYLTHAVAEWVKSDEEKEATGRLRSVETAEKMPTYAVVGPDGAKVSGLDLPRLLSLMSRLPGNAPWQIVTNEEETAEAP